MSKLEEMAHGQDEKGCFKESSARVRAAAENALNACRRKIPAGSAPMEAPPKKEMPTEAAPDAPEPPSSIETPMPTPASNGGAAYRPSRGQPNGLATSGAGEKTWADVRPVSSVGLVEVEDKSPEKIADAVAMIRCPTKCQSRRCPQGHETITSPEQPAGPLGEGKAGPGEAAPGAGVPGGEGEQAAPSPNALAGNYGAASGPMSTAPNMIGDFFSNGGNVIITRPGESTGTFTTVSTGNVAIAGGDRGFKIAENDSPIPRDRVFFGYNHYQDPVVDAQGNLRNLDRFTFGVEKTFFNEWCSLEVRIPFAGGLNSNQSLQPDSSLMATEFGNIPLVFKGIVGQWDTLLLTAGFGLSMPTAKDAVLLDEFGDEEVRIRNNAVRLAPLMGMLWTPNDCWFVLGFAQADFDTRGNEVFLNTGNGLAQAGTIQDQSLLYLDLAIGRWLYKNPSARGITGVVPTVELHYTTTMQDADIVAGPINPRSGVPNEQVGNFRNRVDVVDITGGVHFLLGSCSSLTVAGVVPLRTGDDRMFNAEFLAQFNRRF